MRSRAFQRLGGAVVLGLVLAFGASARAAAAEPGQDAVQARKPLRHEVSVVLKLIQLVVLDKDGNPVTDLAKEDFSLTDNGQPMALTEFERHDARFPAPAPFAAPANPGRLGRKILLLFDFASSDIQGALRARTAALHFLTTGLQPGDEIGILSYSLLRRLRVHEYLTADYARIRAIVEGFGLASSSGRSDDEQVQYERRLAADGATDARPESVLSWPIATKEQQDKIERNLAGDQRFLARNFINTLSGLAQALRFQPGQKHLILFSGGLAGSLINKQPLQGGDLNRDLREAYSSLCRELASANVAVYPISTEPLTAASEAATGAATLREMAQTTGGRYLGLVQNHEEHFRTIRSLTASYYVLGYAINERWDGRYHAVKVKVRRPGCEVRAQAGYFNPKAFADYTGTEKRLDLVDLALAAKPLSQAPLRFSLAAWPLSEGSMGSIGMMAAIPGDAYGELAGRKVEIVRLVFNAIDEIVAESRSEATLPGDGTPLRLASTLAAPPGTAKCRIVLRDLESGRAAVGDADTVVPGLGEAKPRLLPPLLLRPEKGGPRLNDPAPAKAPAGGRPLPEAAHRWLIDPDNYAPAPDDRLAARAEAFALLTFVGPAGQAAGVKISAFLMDTLTREKIDLPLSVLSEARGEELGRFLVRFEVPDLEPDDYRLVFTAEGPDGPIARIVRDMAVIGARISGGGTL